MNNDYITRLKGMTITVAKDINQNRPSENFTVWTPISAKAGERVLVVNVSNAGFRGWELQVRTADGQLFSGVAIDHFAV